MKHPKSAEYTMDQQSTSFANIVSLVPDWSVSSRVTAFCATRSGGVSLPPFKALNLGLHVGDDAEHVLENRRRLEDAFALPASPVWLNQTHSADVIQVPADVENTTAASADGAWTTTHNAVLAVLTADCLPVIISDQQGSQIAVVHAGWRGLAAGILENALAVFPASAELHAWLGPAIGPDAFEVGAEVREHFIERHSGHQGAFAKQPAPGKYKADLYALARSELLNSRAVKVSGGNYCTYSQTDWFYSHRRDGARSGRMATVAWISTASE